MLKQRRRAADIVTADFLAAEKAADEAATLATACLSSMLTQRRIADLPPSTGLTAVEMVSEAASDLLRARHRLVEAHSELVRVRAEIGLSAFYGDTSDCPSEATPSAGRRTPVLSIVAA